MNPSQRIDRRQALKWMAAAATSAFSLSLYANTASSGTTLPPFTAKGYGTDPKLNTTYKPGDLWPLTFNEAQRDLAILLVDLILPADADSPAASAVHVHDFIDEWISAPYPEHAQHRKEILAGFAWLEAESKRRYEAEFRDLTDALRQELANEVSSRAKASPANKEAAEFFARFRDLTAGGYFTTPQGMKYLGYTGNLPLPSFDGPPRDALLKLGLA